MAVTDVKAALRAAHEQANLAAVAWLKAEQPGELERFYLGLESAGATARHLERLQRAVNAEAKSRKRRATQEAAQAAPPPLEQEAGLSNYRIEAFATEKGVVERKIGLPAGAVFAALCALPGGRVRRVAGGAPFVVTAGGDPLYLESATALFGWMQSLFPGAADNPVRWSAGNDMVSPADFYSYVRQCAECFDAVETYPHQPPLPGHFYAHREPEGGDGEAMRELLDHYEPYTELDRQLIHAYFLTMFWGGRPGARPAWLFTGGDGEGDGRGIGKSSIPETGAELVGGSLMVDSCEDLGKVRTRMLSPTGRKLRVLFLDNLKSLKFSWAEFEAHITSPVISGHEMYLGEGQRPNTVLTALTVNGGRLSRDMAQRCVIVKVARPQYRARWKEDVIDHVRTNRWAIIGDAIARLRGAPLGELTKYSRWGSWEEDVLTRVEDPQKCQKLILERQGEVDEDDEEADSMREYIARQLSAGGFDPQTAVVFIPSDVAAEWVIDATREGRSKGKASSYLRQLNVPCLEYVRQAKRRGYRWVGPKAGDEAIEAELPKHVVDAARERARRGGR